LKYVQSTGKWTDSNELNNVQVQNPPIYLRNNTGSTILAYTPVIVNTGGDMDLIDVSNSSKIQIVGLTIANVLNTGVGEIRSDRVLKEITTPFLFGDTVYVSKTGGLTNILPTTGVNGFLAGDFVIKVGVIAKNQTNPILKDIILDPDVIVQLT
jgi:hypothetical protein